MRFRNSSAIVCAVAVIAVIYYFADPMTMMAPKCPFKLLTGFSCPACGAQRALHALLHLHIREAIGYNLFLLAGVPYLSAVLIVNAAGTERMPRAAKAVYSKAAAYSYVALFFVWWIIRNILDI